MIRRVSAVLFACTVGAGPMLGAGEPIELKASQMGGGIDMESDWAVQLKGPEVRVSRRGDSNAKTIRLSVGELETIQRALDQSQFSALRKEYGCTACMDNPVCSVQVSGSGAHTVAVHAYSSDGAPGPDTPEGRELRRFGLVWEAVKKIAGLGRTKNLCP